MSEPPIYRHTDYVFLNGLPPTGDEKASGYEISTDEARPDGKTNGLVKRFDKDETVSDRPNDLGWIKATYANAIEYTGNPKGTRGALLMIGVVGLCLGFLVIGWGIFSIGFADVFPVALGILGIILGVCTSILMPLWAVRLELFTVEDAPTIFDRTNRKVYRITRERPIGLLWLFKPWPTVAMVYDWELIDVEHHAVLQVAPNMVRRQHFLEFLVRYSADNPVIIDTFWIGSTLSLNEININGIWEHIRRFMEEDGPHLPWTHEHALQPEKKPETWWECYSESSVFGAGYLQRWRDTPFLMTIFHIAFPLFFPMGLIWGTGNWLSRKTDQPVRWPKEIRDALGPRLSSKAA